MLPIKFSECLIRSAHILNPLVKDVYGGFIPNIVSTSLFLIYNETEEGEGKGGGRRETVSWYKVCSHRNGERL